jgi:hypothetical protein
MNKPVLSSARALYLSDRALSAALSLRDSVIRPYDWDSLGPAFSDLITEQLSVWLVDFIRHQCVSSAGRNWSL